MIGILNLHKPSGMTSRDVVNVVQRLVRPVKCGHAGTLDPMATGVLLVCVGQATRLISRLQISTKTYRAVITLGQRSDTDDGSGQIEKMPVPSQLPDRSAIENVLRKMTGVIRQVPPAFSAVHVAGRRAYDLARRGDAFELAAKEVHIEHITIHDYEWPKLDVEITCGSGTYIRSIARDLGEALGCGALMHSLVRTRIGDFQLADAIDADQLSRDVLGSRLMNPLLAIPHLPRCECPAEEIAMLRAGRAVRIDMNRLQTDTGFRVDATPIEFAMIADSHEGWKLIAIAERTSDDQLQPRLVFGE